MVTSFILGLILGGAVASAAIILMIAAWRGDFDEGKDRDNEDE